MKRLTKQSNASTDDEGSRRRAEAKARKRISEQCEHTRSIINYRLWAATAYSKLKCNRLKAELSGADKPMPLAATTARAQPR